MSRPLCADCELHDGTCPHDGDPCEPEPTPKSDYTIVPCGPVTVDCPSRPDGYVFRVGGVVLLDTTKSAPDYREALEALVDASSEFDRSLSDREDGYFRDEFRHALTHARKVLHGQ